VEAAVSDGVVAGAVAAVVSGAPSTLHAVVAGFDVLESGRAAGSIVLWREDRTLPLIAAAVPVHVAVSLGWAVVLASVLPRRRTEAWGVAGGLAIAGLDLGVVGRLLPRVRALPQLPQWADHVTYGAVVGYVVARRRRARELATVRP
jgi:hypothetical protein